MDATLERDQHQQQPRLATRRQCDRSARDIEPQLAEQIQTHHAAECNPPAREAAEIFAPLLRPVDGRPGNSPS